MGNDTCILAGGRGKGGGCGTSSGGQGKGFKGGVGLIGRVVGYVGHEDDDDGGPLLPDVTPSRPMKANSFPLGIILDIGAPSRGDHVVPALEVGGLDLLVLPVKGVPVPLLPSHKVCLLFRGLA